MLLRIAMMRNELQRQRKALGREIELRQKERTQLQRKGKPSPPHTVLTVHTFLIYLESKEVASCHWGLEVQAYVPLEGSLPPLVILYSILARACGHGQ